MGTFRTSVVALIGLVGVVVPAVPAAADQGIGPLGVYQPYYPSIWQGFYGGVNLGYGWSGDAQGVVGGGQVGFNWQSQQFVYGIEADLSLSDIGVWLATIRGRYGVLVQPNLLLYATAGLGIVNAETHGSINMIGVGQISARESETDTGFVYGIGVENKLSERMSVRLEYLGFGHVGTVGDFGIVRAGLNFKFGQ